VIACSDARIDPQTIFDAAPGDLFVIRNVAGLVPPYAPDGGCHGTSAALEYAVKILKVRRIVVLGHAKCDGVHALIHGPLRNARDFLDPWIDIAEPVMWPMPEPDSGEALEMAVEDAVLALSLSNLRTFPWIRDGETAGHLALTAWRFDISTCRGVWLDRGELENLLALQGGAAGHSSTSIPTQPPRYEEPRRYARDHDDQYKRKKRDSIFDIFD